MTAKFTPRIQIHVDYEPTLGDGSYPAEVTTKKEAFEFDVKAFRDGLLGLDDLIEFAGDVTVTVVEVKVPA